MGGLAVIANELICGEFIYIWQTPGGLPYCPVQQNAMEHYLNVMKHLFITTNEKLSTLKTLLNQSCIDPVRSEMIQIAIARVFPSSLSAEMNIRNQIRLNLHRLEKSIQELGLKRIQLTHLPECH